jgi:phage terminase small subunit
MALDANGLTPKQARFVEEYMVDCNGTQAAIRAGYSPDTAQEIASQNLSKVIIAEEVAKRKAERSKKVDVTVDSVLQSILEVRARCSQGEPVKDREGNPTGEWKFDPTSVLKANDLLMKHLGMDKGIGSKENPLHVTGISVNFVRATKDNCGK